MIFFWAASLWAEGILSTSGVLPGAFEVICDTLDIPALSAPSAE